MSPRAEARDGAISISARTLPDALAELAREERVSIGAEGALPRVRVPRVPRAKSVADALARILARTGLVARQVGPSAWRIERAAAPIARSDRSGQRGTIPEAEPATQIVVTATKRRLALADAPVALSVVQLPDDRDGDANRDSAWAASQVEGVTLAGQGPGRNRMFLRGVSDSPFNGASQSTVAVILDDSRLTYSAPDPDIRLVDVDRVEVLKGPQGTLYGTGALGGIYHIVTRRPDPSEAAYSVSGGMELLGSGQLGASGSAMANVPLAGGVSAFRVVAYGGKDPGWIDTGDRSDSNRGTVLGVRAGLGVVPANGWRIDITGFGQWLNSADSRYVYAAGARSRPAQRPEPHDNDLRHVSLRAEREGAIGLALSSGMTWQEVRDRYDAPEGADGFGVADPALLDDDREYRTWDSELRLTGANGAIDWIAGLSHVEARQETATTLQRVSGNAVVLRQDERIASDSAAFGEATWALSPELDLLAGARLFRTHFDDAGQAGASELESAHTKVGATPAAALSWQPRGGRLIYFRYGSAFRQGGSSLSSGGQPTTLTGDELATLEAGWRETLGNATFDLGAYYSRWENVQSDMLDADGLLATRNAGDARIIGAEASFSAAPVRGWTLDGGAVWQSALLVRNETGVELDDRRLPAVPEYVLRAAVSRQWTLAAGEAKASASLRYVGPARLSFQPELDLPMGDYLESTLEGHLKIGQVLIGLKVENLFGLEADTFPFGNPLRAATMRQYSPQRPRSLSGQIQWDF